MATTVPYNPVPSVSPTEKATPHVSISAPAAAFGADVGEAFANVGKNVAHFGDEIFQRALALQKLENEAASKEAEADYTIELGKLHANYNSLQGKAAVDAYPKYAKDVQALRVQIGERLGSDTSRKMFDGISRGIASRTVYSGAAYAATQNKKYLMGASRARVIAAADSFYQNPRDDIAIRKFEGMARVESIQQGDIEGWGPEQTENAYKTYLSRAWLKRIEGLANSKPFEAAELMEKNKGKLFGDDVIRAEKVIENRIHSAGSRIISDQVLRPIYSNPEGAKEKGLEQLVKEGEAEAEKRFPNDPVMKGYVRERITIDYNRFKAVRTQAINKDIATVEEAISGKTTGKMLYTEDEIMAASPATAAAWGALPEAKRRALRRVLVANSRGDHLETPENRDRYTMYKGMASLQPDEFLKQTENGFGDMPQKWANELFAKRISLLKRAEADPRVSEAIRTIAQKYGEAVPKKGDGEERYYRFVGAVQDMMAEYEQEHKKPMPFKEKIEMGAFLLQKIDNKYLPEWASRPDRQFDLVPKAVEKLKSDPRWERSGVKPPSDEVLRQMIIRDLYNRSYQKMKAKNKDQDQMLKGAPGVPAEETPTEAPKPVPKPKAPEPTQGKVIMRTAPVNE